MARKAFAVNDAVRDRVRHLAGIGLRQDDIAKIIACSSKTLRKRCRDDLDRGVAEANATVSGYLFAAAKAGNVTAQIFWLKNRKPSEWRDVQNIEHAIGRYIISDRPMTEEEWIKACGATVIDVTPEK